MVVFCGALFDSHPRYINFKLLLMDFFKGQTVDKMELEGLQHVICVSAGEEASSNGTDELPLILFRVYLIRSKKILGSKIPRVELEEMGPRMELKLGRWQQASDEMMSMALKKPKEIVVCMSSELSYFQVKTKKNDTMGDKLGRVYLGNQDLRKLQTRKMRGLKRRAGDTDDEDGTKRIKQSGGKPLAPETAEP